MVWEAIIFGPQDTPFEDGTFKLTLEFTEEYPNKPPNVKFISKMFHPNVYADGSICLDILQVSENLKMREIHSNFEIHPFYWLQNLHMTQKFTFFAY